MHPVDESVSGTTRWRPRVAISMGDPNGIGLEVTLRTLSDLRLLEQVQPIVIAPPHVVRYHARQLGLTEVPLTPIERIEALPEGPAPPQVYVLDVPLPDKLIVEFGALSGSAGHAAMKAVEQAVDLCVAGHVAAMVTAPISKEAITLGGYPDESGHTDFIARRIGATDYTMMMVDEALRVGLVTTHIPIWDVPKRVTSEAVIARARSLHRTLQADFGIQRPRLAVLGLNPHAGDGGVMGRDEETKIIPALQQLRQEGILVTGPHPSDGFFAVGGYRRCDAVLAMYHDQGLIPFKMLAFEQGVNYTGGLPIVRTSPDHGTAFDIAGKGHAMEGSMRQALYVAMDVARRRARQTEASNV